MDNSGKVEKRILSPKELKRLETKEASEEKRTAKREQREAKKQERRDKKIIKKEARSKPKGKFQ